MWIDGFAVTSATNQISGAIPGVTLAATKETTAPITLSLAADPEALRGKIKGVVDAYNAVIGKIHTTAGFGQIAASDSVLTGDSMLRNRSAPSAPARVSRIV